MVKSLFSPKCLHDDLQTSVVSVIMLSSVMLHCWGIADKIPLKIAYFLSHYPFGWYDGINPILFDRDDLSNRVLDQQCESHRLRYISPAQISNHTRLCPVSWCQCHFDNRHRPLVTCTSAIQFPLFVCTQPEQTVIVCWPSTRCRMDGSSSKQVWYNSFLFPNHSQNLWN